MKIKQVLNSVNTPHTRRLLRDLYHRKGPGRKPIDPLAMLKAQLLKHLLRMPSDRRLALRLRNDRRTARACGFKKHTPSHGLFTDFRRRLREKNYQRIFENLLLGLLEDGAWIGGGMVVGVRSLVVFGRCSRVVSPSSWHWLRDLGVGVVVIDDERSNEFLSFAQITLII